MAKQKIIRTRTEAKGGITEAEKALLDQHAAKWIDRIMRTEPIEPDKIIPAIEGMYAASGLKKPKVIIVPSPLVMAVAGGFSRALLASRGSDSATYAATTAATDDATRGGWARQLAGELAPTHAVAEKMLVAARDWWKSYSGGNMWAQYDSYLTAFRDVLGLDLPIYEKYQWWEQAAIHGGFRYMHPDFCMVSDFPEVLRKDERNRPHCADGPSHRWRDGWELYHWHGVRVDKRIIMESESITVAEALAEKNADVRRVMFARIGGARLAAEMPTETIEESPDVSGHPRRLYRINGIEDTLYIDLEDHIGQKHIARAVPPQVRTCDEAVAWRRGAIDYIDGVKRENWAYAPAIEG